MRDIDVQIVRDRIQNLVALKRRVRQVNDFHMAGQTFHEHPAEHRLPAADLPGYLDDAFIMEDCIQKRVERRTAIGAIEEEVRMRRDPERRLVEPEMI